MFQTNLFLKRRKEELSMFGRFIHISDGNGSKIKTFSPHVEQNVINKTLSSDALI